ncbi:hypothetical protein M8C21_000499 [Ambrosia artemisiifolia]|uniref:TFIIS N-terminal domain-containing protein n=1 Tax=Ambrosia artemisiifolia TaxID=4212 RepID=A0AAD5CDY4_AMBAR|nr:hypothetical protein M8C21_000499 [Ambrosia artemisiifolia]
MAGCKSGARMGYWREYFKSCNGDVFEIIEKAIMIAASDYPKEFGIKRDGIAQILIKEIVDNNQDESESMLYNSLRKLQLMNLSVETLKATEIGKSVNVLRKHVSKDVSSIAKTLIEAWKVLVDEWVKATEKTMVSEATPDSVNPSVLDEEEGLPSPPLDDLTFLYPHGSLELSEFFDHGRVKFFDGMDDYGNPGNSGGFNKNHNPPNPKQQKPSNVSNTVRKNEPDSDLVKKKQPSVVKPNTPTVPESGSGRRVKPNGDRKLQNVPKRPPQQIKQKASGEAMTQDKFEETKRKLQERYQQAENAKKQRTIQVMELHDLPKPKGVPVRNQHNARPGSNHNRHR